MKLEYENKVSEKEVLCGVKAKFSKPLAKNTNALIYGDNLSSMRTLVDSSIRFDLCYIDPPQIKFYGLEQAKLLPNMMLILLMIIA